MKLGKLIAALLAAAVVVALAVAYWPEPNQPEVIVPEPVVNVPQGWQSFQKDAISMAYPPEFVSDTPMEPYYFLPNVMLAVKTENASYQRMNYSQRGHVVIASAQLESDACYTTPEVGQAKTFDGVVSLNGTTWRTVSFADAGAGNRYETTLYRVHHKGTCYEVVTTLHYASDWNDIDMAAAEQSQKEMREAMREVVETVTVK